MSSSTSHPQSATSWASSSTTTHGGLSTSLTDTFGQARTHYQPGYMMSTQQHNVMPQSTQHADEIPTVQTKAKINMSLTRGGSSHFGAESMFESRTTQRQTFTDMDAPPTSSINDVFKESSFGASDRAPPRPFSLNTSTFHPSPGQPSNETPPATASVTYIIVFGYPLDKYSLTVEYFKSLGTTTEPEPNSEIVNCFRIGYRDPGEALRAVRRNGEILGGSWMIGVKWADSASAGELGPSMHTSDFAASTPPPPPLPQGNAMLIDSPPLATSVGTPIRLAPSVAAFRKGGPAASASPAQKVNAVPIVASAGQSPNKGMLGQVTDLLFGW
ncbi:hypothetical protein F5I97DRAFT_1915949 [Phlebopus sp. FC_14]|nr:hypothetical protein F5I97DRAFT_1915949 [Phlebopus sp. FC_14]